MYAILFDIDGTLVLTGGAGQLAFAQTFAEDFGIDEISRGVPFAGRTDRAISLDLMRVHGIEPNEANWTRFREGYLQRLPSALAQRIGEVLPGVGPLLDALEQRTELVLGLLTGNLERGAQLKLGHYGLAERFAFRGYGDHSVSRDDVGADAVTHARQHAADRGEELTGMMVIGDTLHDITCARSVGAYAVAVATGSPSRSELMQQGPDLALDDLSDLDPVLAAVDACMATRSRPR